MCGGSCSRQCCFPSCSFYLAVGGILGYRKMSRLLECLLLLTHIRLSQIGNIWAVSHQPFKEAGEDTLFLASPNGNLLWTCDAAIIKQLFTLSTLQVPVDMLKFYDIWGPTVGSVEGEEWKRHRKVVAYGLNPSTQPMVWKEAIEQTDTLIQRWNQDSYQVPVVRRWTSRLALHTIASVFFDMKLTWKEYSLAKKASGEGYQTDFASALFTVLDHMGLIFMVPRPLLGKLPFKATKETHVAYNDWTNYMQDLRKKAAANIDSLSAKRQKTLIESIVVAGTSDESDPTKQPLSEGSVLGNIFFTLMAGHETTGNTLAFVILLLAVYPEHQATIQHELDEQLGNRSKEEWSVECDFAPLQKGHLGAVIKETLRLYNVIQFIFRYTVAPTTLRDSKGVEHSVPANTTCLIDYAAAFHNPSIWRPNDISPERRVELHNSPALDFDPSRFADGKEHDDGFFPFGHGPRKCPGMPFAQVEMVAILATILKNWSIELVVPEDVIKMIGADVEKAREITKNKAIRQLKNDVDFNYNIQMAKELPIKLVPRN